ncbi:MAG: efflux RND transporter periplasmic adaptor subunit [Bacteroidales bacterium]|nr:efflux RND transporter periplasmic adaptor subunit [Bacteroidales bacterium]
MVTRITILAFILFFLASCRHVSLKQDIAEPVRVKVDSLFPLALSLPVHTNGTLVATEELKLSFKTGGIVSAIFVREGDKVKKGDPLASLDLVEIKANAEQAEIAYEKALRDYLRAENLFKEGALSLEKKQNAETAMNIAKNTLEIARFNLQHSRIKAPDNGFIMKQFVKENELVSSGYPVFLFGSSGKFWKVEAGLSDRHFIKINPGDSAIVLFDAYPGVKFSGRVDQLGEMSNPYTGTYKAELTLEDSGYRLASGFIASIEIFPSVRDTYTMVPVESLVEADEQHGYIYAVSAEGNARKIRVEIVTLTGSLAAVRGIPSGVKEIVSEGMAYLRDGIGVQIVR